MNKTLLKRVSTEFRNWIHSDEKTKEDKLRLIRSLDSEDAKDDEMLTTARAYVGSVLVAYAQGNPNAKTVKPYGLKAARSTKAFKSMPTNILALTFAALYQVVRTDSSLLDKWIRTPRQNITQPWPRGMIKRFVNLQKVFQKNRDQVFKSYEDDGGEYMGPDVVTERTRRASANAHEEDFEEDFD